MRSPEESGINDEIRRHSPLCRSGESRAQASRDRQHVEPVQDGRLHLEPVNRQFLSKEGGKPGRISVLLCGPT
jgi:hypothetical protein